MTKSAKARAQGKQELRDKLLDQSWRLKNLYKIKEEGTGKVIQFSPKPEQADVLQAVEDGYTSIFIPKSRRLGMSTVTEVLAADKVFWSEGFEASLIDKTGADATRKLNNMVKTAYQGLPEFLRNKLVVDKSNDSEFSVRGGDSASSHFYAGTNFRGGDCGLMHISELGWIQWWDPRRAEEIVTGALPAARKAIRIIETTWKGGKNGEAWDIIKPALEITDAMRTLRDWRVMFFPWYGDPACEWAGAASQISIPCQEYFAEMEASHGVSLPDEKRLWYYKEAWPLGNRRFQEYPSLLEECFSAVVEGAIYEQEFSRALAEQRCTRFPLEPGLPVVANFDLGYEDAMPCTFTQRVGQEHRVFDYFVSHRQQVGYYVAMLQAWKQKHDVAHLIIRLPHDGGKKSIETGKTIAQKFLEGGFPDVQVVQRAPRVWIGIDAVRDMFPYLWIHSDNCAVKHETGSTVFPSFLECLQNYHQRERSDGRRASPEPVHDRFSHGADSLRTYAEGYARGLSDTPTHVPEDLMPGRAAGNDQDVGLTTW